MGRYFLWPFLCRNISEHADFSEIEFRYLALCHFCNIFFSINVLLHAFNACMTTNAEVENSEGLFETRRF